MPKIRVLLTDDHSVLREGLRALLAYYDDIEVVGEAQNGEAAIERVGDLRPDVVLMDISMPGMNGIEATQLIHKHYPETCVLILTRHEDHYYVLPLLQSGARGYLPKRALSNDLVTAIRAVAKGEMFLHSDFETMVVEEMRRNADVKTSKREALTLREREVLKYIAQGQTNSRIAVTLSLSVKTIEWHRMNLMSKLGVHSVAELVRYAIAHGIID